MTVKLFKSLETQSLRTTLNIAFAMIFTLPLLLFFACSVYFKILYHPLIQISFAGYLTFSLFGYVILRRIVYRIIDISSYTISPLISPAAPDQKEQNELKKIASTFDDLLKRLEESTTNLGKRVNELTSMRELLDISSKITDTHQLFLIVLDKLMATTNAKYGRVMSLTKDGVRFVLEGLRGIDQPEGIPQEIATDKTILSRVLGDTPTYICNDPSKENFFDNTSDGVFVNGPFIVKSIKARGKIIGILNLSRGEGGKSFLNEELDYLSTVLGQIAFAFDNTQLIREMKDAYEELKTMQEKLIVYERTAAINQTVVTLSDRINNALTAIQGHTELLRKNIIKKDPEIERSLNVISESTNKCTDIMKKLREIPEPHTTKYIGEIKMIDVEGEKNKE